MQPATVKEIQTVLFLRKLPRHIRNLINPREFQDPKTLTQWCNCGAPGILFRCFELAQLTGE
jgi:hypothetical protein